MSPAPSFLSRIPPWPCSKTRSLTAEPGWDLAVPPAFWTPRGLLHCSAASCGPRGGHSQRSLPDTLLIFLFLRVTPLPSPLQHPLSPPKFQAAPLGSSPTPQTHLCQTTLSHHPHLQLPTFALTPLRGQNAHPLSRPTAAAPRLCCLSASHTWLLRTPSGAQPCPPHWPAQHPQHFPTIHPTAQLSSPGLEAPTFLT